jgi:hypothetical protein
MERSPSLQLKNSLEALGRGFTSDDEIAKYIEKLGLKQINPKGVRTADWTFEDPATRYKYVSYVTGDVRSVSPLHRSYFGGHMRRNVTRTSRGMLNTPRERLLLILRRTMKSQGIYKWWKGSKKTVKEFLDSNAPDTIKKAISVGLI